MTSAFRPPVSRGYVSSTNFYFSALAPSTRTAVSPAISPVTTYTSNLSPASPPSTDYPIITTTVRSRNQSGTTSTSNSLNAHDQALRQFAQHIPTPPSQSLGAASREPATAVNTPTHPGHSRTASHYETLPSPMDRCRRMPPSNHTPQMTVASTLYNYTLSVKLSPAIQPEMVTVCANKGDKLKVVADAWHREDESHYEWQICFPPRDIDMGSVHASLRFDDGEKTLTIDVRRIPRLYR
ncbi:hypothetical protein DFP72DRAFT_1064564 [Ephemerocybe angulata]|uniref:Uncharacterized protein n=1 Tax=Ephemerocybe angulata TaxID=980116 RepID=A0A8H6HXG1_9AGAR|nr:hypothetical protein DFP72DRAFT_1068156 [Tulosesus angulatus]KAF6759066.1 hypothetical protein DFP72DRAFT_1064564 [Tulosesus angulatus]